jgi:hypothetical protein
MLRQRKLPPGFTPPHRPKTVDMTGEVHGDFTMVKAGYRGSWWGQCSAGHERILNGGQLRADRKAGRPGPRCRECRKAAHP